MPRLKVYISSTYLDLAPIRRDIINKIQDRLPEYFELTEVMEKMRGDGENRPNVDICLDNVRAADVYILLLGNRYGSFPAEYRSTSGAVVKNTDEKSFTWLEYETAVEMQQIKRYRIYKLQFGENFFSGTGLDPQTDLDRGSNQERFARFKAVHGRTVSPIPVHQLAKLGDEVNDLLTDSFLVFNTITQLQITEEHECSINRHPQVKTLQEKMEELGVTSAVPVLMLNTCNGDDDRVDKFVRRVREILTPGANTSGKSTELVDFNTFANYRDGKDNEMRAKFLLHSSANIIGETARRINFDALASQINNGSIRNRFLGFQVDLSMDSDKVKELTGHLCDFINYLDHFLNERQFIYNFFVILCVICKEDKTEQFRKDYLSPLKPDLYDLGRLSTITLQDIGVWLDTVITDQNAEFKANFKSKQSEIIKQIFVDTATFPKSYKKCLEDIKSKAK